MRFAATGISRRSAAASAREIEEDDGNAFVRRARREMADEEEKRLGRLSRELGVLDRELEHARERVGIEPDELQSVIHIALARGGVPLTPAADLGVDSAFQLDPNLPIFAKDSSWADLFDELREGRPPKRKQLAKWRVKKPVRAVTFEAPVLPDGRDAEGVVHVHLEHRLVRRLLSRFISHGFQAGLSRASVIYSPGS